jgi:hypothetical protein
MILLAPIRTRKLRLISARVCQNSAESGLRNEQILKYCLIFLQGMAVNGPLILSWITYALRISVRRIRPKEDTM